jgi:glutaminyl-peptide cyclotransferase
MKQKSFLARSLFLNRNLPHFLSKIKSYNFVKYSKGLAIYVGLCSSIYSCKEEVKTPTPVVEQPQTEIVENMTYTLNGQLPHDVASFTEGLLFNDGKMYESTGSPEEMKDTRSLIGPVDLATGKMAVKVEIDRNKYFGEGITFLNGNLYQLTYKNQTCFIYDAKTYKPKGSFKYANAEGWGMTTDGKSLIMSDGTDKITYLDPAGKVEKTISITAYGKPLQYINELEYINGHIYANVWTTNYVVKIDPNASKVVGKLDFSSLANDARSKNPRIAEMNGIAYNPASDQIYVTGKFWPNIYQISFSH